MDRYNQTITDLTNESLHETTRLSYEEHDAARASDPQPSSQKILCCTPDHLRVGAPEWRLRTTNATLQVCGPSIVPLGARRTSMDAPARLAFARSEASWRQMLLTQPPICQLDWWHTSDTAKCIEGNTGSDPIMSGDGHGRTYDKSVTLGMLWDMIEARLVRGCSCRMTLFLSGCPLADDPTASGSEKAWAGARRGCVATAPRIRLDTHQEWTVEPSMYQHFDAQQGSWNVEDELPWKPSTEDEGRRYEDWNSNCLIWLNEDCKRDGEESSKRWSRSDDCIDSSLSLRNAGGGRRNHEEIVRRLATRDRIRTMIRNR